MVNVTIYIAYMDPMGKYIVAISNMVWVRIGPQIG